MTKPSLKELKSIHEWVRESSISEVSFVSLLILPLFIALYSWVIDLIELEQYKTWIIIPLIVLYCIAIIVMKVSQTIDEGMEIAWLIIKNHAKSNKIQYIGFEKLKEKDKKYTKAYLKRVIRKYPSELIVAKFDNNQREGLKVLNYQRIVDEDS